jgi:hypothetical protein
MAEPFRAREHTSEPKGRIHRRPQRYFRFATGDDLKWDEQAVKLWLCLLSPYFVILFVRSVIWSVNTLRRH